MRNKEVYKIVTISDIHMGALDPQYMYIQLKQQFIDRLINLDFDILAICGDIFDSRFMSNNPIISYTIQLVNDIVNLCTSKNATLIIIDGTQSHDNGQLSLFYHYMQEQKNVRIPLYKNGVIVILLPRRCVFF